MFEKTINGKRKNTKKGFGSQLKNNYTRRSFLSRTGIGITVITAGIMPFHTLTGKPSREKPNFIIIFTDDMGYGDLSCYGSELISTPRIDRMAEEGKKFTDFYVTAPFCSPSRASILTGRYPVRAGVPNVLFPTERIGLSPEEKTIAEVLKSNGYATACIGKWHLGNVPKLRAHRRGFNFFYGLLHSNDLIKWDGKGRFKPWWGHEDLALMENDKIIEAPVKQETLTKRYTEQAIKFITKNKDKPFFLYLPHTFPHSPYYASDEFRGKSKRGIYGDTIEEIDWSTGKILDTLKKLKIDNNTLVIFTSDNGPAPKRINHGDTGPLSGIKGQTKEGGMRVPAIFRWPRRIPTGSLCRKLVSTLDIFPTLTKLAGAELPRNIIYDGYDISDQLFAKKDIPTKYKLFCYYFGTQLQAVRRSPWKLFLKILKRPEKPNSLWYKGNDRLFKGHYKLRPKPLLYNLDNDIGERINLAKRHPDIVKKLDKMAREFDAEMQKNKRLVQEF